MTFTGAVSGTTDCAPAPAAYFPGMGYTTWGLVGSTASGDTLALNLGIAGEIATMTYDESTSYYTEPNGSSLNGFNLFPSSGPGWGATKCMGDASDCPNGPTMGSFSVTLSTLGPPDVSAMVTEWTGMHGSFSATMVGGPLNPGSMVSVTGSF
jgi:hypothetical protein